MSEAELPSNTKKDQSATTPAEKPPVEKIVTGEVIKRKTPLSRKLKNMVLGEDFQGSVSYVKDYIIIPALRDMVFGAFTKAAERRIYPEQERQRRSRAPSSSLISRISFNAPVQRDPRETGMLPHQPPHMATGRRTQDIGDIILSSREEAEAILEQLDNFVEKYGRATQGDLFASLGYPISFTDEAWGWTNLVKVKVKQVKEGFLIDLPDPEALPIR